MPCFWQIVSEYSLQLSVFQYTKIWLFLLCLVWDHAFNSDSNASIFRLQSDLALAFLVKYWHHAWIGSDHRKIRYRKREATDTMLKIEASVEREDMRRTNHVCKLMLNNIYKFTTKIFRASFSISLSHSAVRWLHCVDKKRLFKWWLHNDKNLKKFRGYQGLVTCCCSSQMTLYQQCRLKALCHLVTNLSWLITFKQISPSGQNYEFSFY